MTADTHRVLRMVCQALLLVSLPIVGFVWALPESIPNLAMAGGLTLLSLSMGFCAEYLASSTENDLQQLGERIVQDSESRAVALEERDEKLRQFDRMVSVLTAQNHDLRAKLVSMQVSLQRQQLVEAAGQAIAFDDAVLVNPYAARAS